MPKELSAEQRLRFHSRDIIEKAVKVRDEGKVPYSVEQVDAPVVGLSEKYKGKRALSSSSEKLKTEIFVFNVTSRASTSCPSTGLWII